MAITAVGMVKDSRKGVFFLKTYTKWDICFCHMTLLIVLSTNNKYKISNKWVVQALLWVYGYVALGGFIYTRMGRG